MSWREAGLAQLDKNLLDFQNYKPGIVGLVIQSAGRTRPPTKRFEPLGLS